MIKLFKIPLFLFILSYFFYTPIQAIRKIYNNTEQTVEITEFFPNGPMRKQSVTKNDFVSIHNSAIGIAILYQHSPNDQPYIFTFPYGSFPYNTTYNLYTEIIYCNSAEEDIKLATMLTTQDPLLKPHSIFFHNTRTNLITLICVDQSEQYKIHATEEYPIYNDTYSNLYAYTPIQKLTTTENGLIFYTTQQDKYETTISPDSRNKITDSSSAIFAINSNNSINLEHVAIVQALRNWFSDEDSLHTITYRSYKKDLSNEYPINLILNNLHHASVNTIIFHNQLGIPIPHFLGNLIIPYCYCYIEFSLPGAWYNPKNICFCRRDQQENNGVSGIIGNFYIGFTLGIPHGRLSSSFYITNASFIPNKENNLTCWHENISESNKTAHEKEKNISSTNPTINSNTTNNISEPTSVINSLITEEIKSTTKPTSTKHKRNKSLKKIDPNLLGFK